MLTDKRKQFEIMHHEEIYRGFFRLEQYRLRHTLYEGGWSDVVERELFRRGNCVAVLLYDPWLDRVVMIEQFRVGAILRAEPPWLLEIVAGAIEEGETPEQVAYREAYEEAGCRIEALELIGEFYTTPGGSSEWISLFYGRINSEGVGGFHGLKDEQEDIFVETFTFAEVSRWLQEKRINSGIPLIALQWLALNRHRLRSDIV